MHCLVKLCNCAVKHTLDDASRRRARDFHENHFLRQHKKYLSKFCYPWVTKPQFNNEMRCFRRCLFTHFGLSLARSIAPGGSKKTHHKKIHYLIVCAKNYIFSLRTAPALKLCIKTISPQTFEFSVEKIFELTVIRRSSIIPSSFVHFCVCKNKSSLRTKNEKVCGESLFMFLVESASVGGRG